jgi:hypothetical protein
VVADEDVADGHADTSAKRMSDARDVRERESKAVAFGRRPGVTGEWPEDDASGYFCRLVLFGGCDPFFYPILEL